MRQVRWAVPGLAVVALATAGVWSMTKQAPGAAVTLPAAAEPRAPVDLEREVRALRAELESLRQGQGRLARQVESPSSGEAASAPAPAAEEERPVDAVPSEVQRAAAEEARRERTVELEAELEAAANTEPRDREWAGATEALVTGAFRGPDLADSRLTRVDCRTRLCVLEVEHEGPEARAELLGSLLRVPGLQGQAVLRPSGDGTKLASRVYLSRPGERLPMTLRR